MLQAKSPLIVASLKRALEAHHILFMHCYHAFGLAKQKLHYIAHIPRCIQRFKKVLSCFNAEATHKFSKRVMHAAYKSCHRTALSYELHRMLGAACDVSTFLSMYLLPRILNMSSSAALVAALPSHVVTAASAITASRGIRHARGTFKRGHVLVWSYGGSVNVCKARLFIAARTGTATEFFLWIDHWTSSLDAHGRTLWSSSLHDKMIPADLIVASVPSAQIGDKHIVYIPGYM